jgi:hypothetical protein
VIAASLFNQDGRIVPGIAYGDNGSCVVFNIKLPPVCIWIKILSEAPSLDSLGVFSLDRCDHLFQVTGRGPNGRRSQTL